MSDRRAEALPVRRAVHSAAAPTSLAVWAGLLTIYLVWGSTYLGIRIAIETIPPFLMAATRFLLAGGLLYLVAIRGGDREGDRPGRTEWRDATISAGFFFLGGMGLVALGEQTVPSGIAALLIALMPLWLAVIGRIWLGERLPTIVLAGIALGIVGVAVLAAPTGAERLEPSGLAALIVSPISWATGSLYTAHRAHLPRRPLVGAGMQMLAGSVLLGIAGLVTGEVTRIRVEDISPESLWALVYLTFVGSLVGFTAYGWLLRVAPLSLVGTYAYVNPVVAVFLGWVLLAEPITSRTVVAGAIIVMAVAIIVTTRGRLTRRLPPEAG